ncbi:MAG: citrate synthase [Deltaproteobacteria bacterium]|nr:citrate synthase [Deltaproteobacteria bacterium]
MAKPSSPQSHSNYQGIPGTKLLGNARLTFEDKEIDLPVFEGTEGDRAVDISQLRAMTGLVTFDNGFGNTGSCISSITYINGEKGILRYRGYDIEDLARNCKFVEVAYLLLEGKLPTEKELGEFSSYLNEHALIHEDMTHFFTGYPRNAHPMAILAATIASLSTFYPELEDEHENFKITTARMLSKARTIAAFSYKKSRGEPFVYPRYDLSYCANFLNMMFASSIRNYEPTPLLVKALNLVMVLHADHEQNCSTSTVRMVGSGRVNLYAAISSGMAALWGPLHGGASQHVLEMLERIRQDDCNYKKYIEMAKDKKDPFRMMGFGHRIYKNYDPRARILKETCDEVLDELKHTDPLVDIAKRLEEIALRDDYFVEKKLYPNVDFYSGLLYRAMGIPLNMMVVMFAIARIPGQVAQWHEEALDPNWKIWRPRQIYSGESRREFLPMEQRV